MLTFKFNSIDAIIGLDLGQTLYTIYKYILILFKRNVINKKLWGFVVNKNYSNLL